MVGGGGGGWLEGGGEGGMAQTGLGTPPPNHLGNGNLGWSYHGACLNVKK